MTPLCLQLSKVGKDSHAVQETGVQAGDLVLTVAWSRVAVALVDLAVLALAVLAGTVVLVRAPRHQGAVRVGVPLVPAH